MRRHSNGRTASAAGLLPDFLDLPHRPPKPRRTGITYVLDKGMPLAYLESLLDLAGDHVDVAKLGWGTAYVSREVRRKVAAYRAHNVRVSTGGTLFEVAAAQGRVAELARWAASIGVDTIEVSDGSTELDHRIKCAYIAELARDFTVLSEVGSKNPRVAVVADEWASQAVAELEAGAAYVITEGRESGTVGVFDPGGCVREDLVDTLLREVPRDRLIFEAPHKAQQAWFISNLGSDVNLGNICTEDVVSVETLRLGLRGDTVALSTRVAVPI